MLWCKSKEAKKEIRKQTKEASAELQSLKDQVEALLNQRVTPALTEAVDRAEHVVQNARGVTDEQMRHVSTHVQSRPLVALGISAVIGYLVGRIIR